MPAATPATIPVLPTVATDVVDELQVPPVVALDSVMVLPALTVDGPVIVPAPVAGLTVITFVATPLPHAVVTV